MAREINVPSEKFDAPAMFEATAKASQEGFMKAQEAQVRVTTDMLQSMYIAGYRQCMIDHGIPVVEDAAAFKG